MPQEDNSPLSIVDSSGRQVSILNHHADNTSSLSSPQDDSMMDDDTTTLSSSTRRKYACNASGCFKSFTTSGHLARHHRIHTGEKNFPCLFPGCQSRFSRQDNMMQHYRTHMSPKSRRTSKKQHSQQQQQQQQHHLHRHQQQHQQSHSHSPYDPSHPRLHAHHRIHSDVTAPLSIDQHLRNYHQSRLYHHQRHLSTASSRSSSSSSSPSPPSPTLVPTTATSTSSLDPTIKDSALPSSPSSSHLIDRHQSIRHHNDNMITTTATTATTANYPPRSTTAIDSHVHRNSITPPTYTDNANATMFYQHRPLNYTECEGTQATTLLNPTPINKANNNIPIPSSLSASSSSTPTTTSSSSKQDDDMSSNSLIQLANIVSSFG